jgi:hypothetical protein
MLLPLLITMLAGWFQRHHQPRITSLHEEHRVLKAHLGGRRLLLTDTERRRLAALAHPLGRKRLQEVATLMTPDTLLCWYKCLIAQKFDGSRQRRQAGMRWAPFLKRHGEVPAATDFCIMEVATWHGVMTYDVLVVMELATRRVQTAGITPHSTAACMQQCARQFTAPFDGCLPEKWLSSTTGTPRSRRRLLAD